MTMAKNEVLELVQRLPDLVDIEDLIHQLYLREKLARAEEDIALGRVLSMQEVRDQVARWQK